MIQQLFEDEFKIFFEEILVTGEFPSDLVTILERQMIEAQHLAGVVGANQTGTLKMLLKSVAYQYGRDAETKLSDTVKQAQAAGISLISILTALLPLVLSLFSGQKLDLQTIINAILALIPK